MLSWPISGLCKDYGPQRGLIKSFLKKPQKPVITVFFFFVCLFTYFQAWFEIITISEPSWS